MGIIFGFSLRVFGMLNVHITILKERRVTRRLHLRTNMREQDVKHVLKGPIEYCGP